MLVQRSCFAVALAVAWLSAAPPACGDDLAPPSFRGQPHSVMAKFALGGGQDEFNAVPGIYPLDPLQPMIGQGMTDPTNNSLVYPVALPNFIDPLPLKLIRIQYSWFGSTTGNPGDAAAINILPSPAGAVQLVNATPPVLVPGSVNLYHRWDDYEIRPNPDSERFEIAFFDADPRWLVIDTISLPEPSAAALLGLAMLGFLARKR